MSLSFPILSPPAAPEVRPLVSFSPHSPARPPGAHSPWHVPSLPISVREGMHPGKLVEMETQEKNRVEPWGVVHNTFQRLAHRSQGRIDFCPVQVRREKQGCCRNHERSLP